MDNVCCLFNCSIGRDVCWNRTTSVPKSVLCYVVDTVKLFVLSMDDSSNGRAVALYPDDPGSNPRSGSI